MLALVAFAAHGLASSGGLAAQTAAWELHTQGKMMEAIHMMKKAVATAPPEAITPRFDLACMWEDIGYLDEAEEGFKGLAAEHDGWKTYWANVLHDGRGLREQALALYREASAASVSYKEQGRSVAFHTNALYGRGVCAESLGLVDEAADCHRRCLQLDPTDASAAFHLLVNSERRSGSTCDALREELAQLLPTYRLGSWDYVQRHPRLAPSTHLYTHGLLHRALDALDPTLDDGLVLEFGVYFGKTLRMIASRLPDATVHGFDTFTGLPEEWSKGSYTESKGSYTTGGLLPPAPSNVCYHVGTFAETLPAFLEAQPGPVRFMNIDCDLYSSTKDILDALHTRVVVGTVIVFDEYVMTSNWREDEFKAFQEAVAERGWQYEYLGISLVSGQAAVRITAV